MPNFMPNFDSLGLTVLWVAILIVGIAVECATFSLVSIWFAIGALVSLVALTLGAGFMVQIILFALVSAIMLMLIRPFVKDVLKPRGSKTNADRIIGETALVTEEISNALSKGQVKVFGQIWSAKSADDSIIKAGQQVKICEIRGVKVVVKPLISEKG